MAPSRIDNPLPSFTQTNTTIESYEGPPRNLANINAINFDKALQPKKYEILGTHPDSKILFKDVHILDSTGSEPYRGDVLVEGERISKVGVVPNVEELHKDPKVRVFHGRGRTLMSGLGDAHTHLSKVNPVLQNLFHFFQSILPSTYDTQKVQSKAYFLYFSSKTEPHYASADLMLL